MEIERHGLPLDVIDLLDSPCSPSIWQQTEIATATDGKVHAGDAYRRRRQLDKGTGRASKDVGVALGIGNAVSVVVNREDARIVLVAFFNEDVERPQARGHDRKAWRAKTGDGAADGVFE